MRQIPLLIACLAVSLVSACEPDEESGSGLPLLALPSSSAPGAPSESMLPYSLELQADVVALGEIGQPFQQEGRQLLKLTLSELLKGEASLRTVFPEDRAPWFGCIPPEREERPSEQLSPGTRVLVYLTQDKDKAWSILHIRPASDSVDDLRRFFKLHARIHSASPDWASLFEDQLTGLDSATFYAFGYQPLPDAAGPPLVAHLERVVRHLQEQEEPPPNLEPLSNLVQLINRMALPQALASQRELVTWASERAGEGNRVIAYLGTLYPVPDLLSTLDAESAEGWYEPLERVFSEEVRRVDLHAYGGAAALLGALPGARGATLLFDALRLHPSRTDVTRALTAWAKRESDSSLRTEMRREIDRLRATPGLQEYERHYLEELLTALE